MPYFQIVRSLRLGVAVAVLSLTVVQPAYAQSPAAPLKVCIQEDNSPLSLKRRAGFTGFDIDLANALAAELKQPLKIIPFEAELEKEASIANDVNAMLSMGVCDLVSGYALYASALGAPATLTARPPEYDGGIRRKRDRPIITLQPLTASVPYLSQPLAAVARDAATAGALNSLRDFEERKAGAIAGTVAGAVLTLYRNGMLKKDLVSVGQREDLLDQLEQGVFDVALVPVGKFDAYKKRKPQTSLTLGKYRHSLSTNIGFVALQSNQALLDKVNAFIASVNQDGRLAKLAEGTGMTYVAPTEPAVLPPITMRILREAR
jgi:ABC-type amino acid transport substrate-binding protein